MRNYKTTLSGVIIAGLMGAEPIIQNGDLDLKRDWLKLAISVGIAIFGLFSKDHNEVGPEKSIRDYIGGRPNDRP